MNNQVIHLLLIEDDLGDADLIQEILFEKDINRSFRLQWVDRLKAGLARLAQEEYDVVLLDLSLPDSQGLETFRRVNAQVPKVPIVVLSGLDDERVAIKAVGEGAQDYLVKGEVNNHLLVRALRYAIERKQAQLERMQLTRRLKEQTAKLSLANAELSRAARLKDEFLASMSHELRTPLSAILGLAEVLQEELHNQIDAEQYECLGDIEQSGRHLLSLINDILDVAKIEAGKVELQITSVELDALCASSLQFIRQTASKKRLKLSQSFTYPVSHIPADERRLKQILINLLSNAVKFTPVGGHVGLEVSLEQERQVIRLTVWDTGIGIAPEELPHLFKPFVQLHSSRDLAEHDLSEQHHGTGLGLVLVHRLTELHGGGVQVESQPGKGSRFSILLPLRETTEQESHSPAKEEKAPPPLPRPTTCSRILLAEDNEGMIRSIVNYLEAKGYSVTVARNGNEAIARATEELPDIILMDIQMPQMDGLQAIRHLRNSKQLATIPIIALTALAMPGDREQILAVGANDYLSKPVRLRTLLQTIEHRLR